jgi:hypothetical protein
MLEGDKLRALALSKAVLVSQDAVNGAHQTPPDYTSDANDTQNARFQTESLSPECGLGVANLEACLRDLAGWEKNPNCHVATLLILRFDFFGGIYLDATRYWPDSSGQVFYE